jgi:hypothetical protein
VADVIVVGDFSLYRETAKNGCEHVRLFMDSHGETVQCQDCKVYVTAWWALSRIREHWANKEKALAEQRARLEEDRAAIAAPFRMLKITKRLDRMWRGQVMAPCCPHCKKVVLPEDNFGSWSVNVEMERARRSKGETPK